MNERIKERHKQEVELSQNNNHCVLESEENNTSIFCPWNLITYPIPPVKKPVIVSTLILIGLSDLANNTGYSNLNSR